MFTCRFAGGMSLYDESEIYNPPEPSGPPLAKKYDPGRLDSVNRECTTHYTESRSASQPAGPKLSPCSSPPTINHQVSSVQIPSISIQPL